MSLRLRRWLLVVLAVALVTAALLPLWLARHQLPDSLATHWSDMAAPDGWMSLPAFAQMIAQLVGVGAALLLTAAVWMTPEATRHAPLRAVGAFLGATFAGLAASIAVWTVVTQRGLESTRELPGPGGLSLVVIVGMPVLLGAGSALLARGQLEAPAHGLPPHSLRLAEGEQATWWQRLRAPWSLLILLLAIEPLVLGVLLDSLALSVGSAVLVAVAVGVSSIRVSADHRGLIVRWGPLGWPTTTVPLHDIARATAIDVSPIEWGGWGYRGSLRLFGRAAIVLRAGPGLRLDLRSGKVMTVTVDDPETAAGLLNQLIVRSGAGRVP